PPSPSPSPLLPLQWQRACNVPRASVESELAYARAMTLRFSVAAPVVVFSNAALRDDLPLAPSALLLGYPQAPELAHVRPTWTRRVAGLGLLESVADDNAPPLADGAPAPGGSRIVAAQSDCPFQAFARHPLRVDP